MSEQQIPKSTLDKLAEVLTKREIDASQEHTDKKADLAHRMQLAQDVLKRQALEDKFKYLRCNHLKGGHGVEAVLNGTGDRPYDTAINGFRLPLGSWVYLCTRCRHLAKEGDPVYKKFEKMAKRKLGGYQPSESLQMRVRPLTNAEIKERIAELEAAAIEEE